MKKLFTLIAAALMTIGASAAQKDLGNPTNNASGGWFDEATKKITFVEAGSYKPGWWLAWNNATSSNSGQDFSAYDKVVVELTDIQNCGTISVYFEYVTDGVEQDIATVDATTGKATITLKDEGKSAVKQMYLQATEAGGTCTFVAAYAENDEAPLTEIDLFKGTSTVPLGWNEDAAKGEVNMVKGIITDDAQSLLKVGNYIGIDYTCEPYESDEDSRYYQVQFMGGWWTVLDGAVGTNGAEKATNGNVLIPLEATSTNVEFKLTESDVATLKAQGSVKLAGHGIYVSRIYISEKSQAPASDGGDTWNFETAISAADKASLEATGSTWKAPVTTYKKDADGNTTTEISYVRYELNTELAAKVSNDFGEFVTLKGNDGTELECTKGLKFARYNNALKAGNIRIDAYSRLGLNGGGLAVSIPGLKKDDVIKIKFASTGDEARGFDLTNAKTNDADAKTQILSGKDKAAVEFELKVVADGEVILKSTNGVYIYAIAVNAALPTGIQETVAPVKVINNGAIYNLAGQKVNESYKGIVIKNGKKYFQK